MASSLSIVASSCAVVLALPAPAAAADWKPVDKTELALAAPVIDAAADAEALFWDIRVADEIDGFAGPEPQTTFEHYIRIKIFTARGRDAHATVDIPYVSGVRVSDVAARTVRPDGSVIELKGSDVYRRTILKSEGLRVDVVSFALPAVEAGAIVEYRWRERYRDSLANYLRLPFSREIPVHHIRYYIRPLSIPGLRLNMQAWSFNADIGPPERQRDGYSLVSLSKVPAYREEPYSRPEWARKPWMLIFYSLGTEALGDKFWKQYSKMLHDAYARRVKPNDEIRRVAAAAVASATTDDERAAALLRVIHERVKRVDVDTADPADWRKAKDNKNAGDVLKRRVGTAEDAVMLFVALASAAGLDARVAAAPDRATTVINQSYGHPFFFGERIAAVRSGGGWKFYDPGNEYSVEGRLRWRYELQKVFVADPRDTLLVDVPLAPAEASAKRRAATLRLLEDGTLEGECQVTYTGHWDESVKEQDDQDTPSEREKNYREQLLKRWAGAEITGLTIENATDPLKPYTASFRVKLAGYAQRTGSRLVFQPAVFQRGVGPLFTAGERTGDVYFPFPWSEHDQVTIELPPGFELEQPEAPSALKSNAARYAMELKLSAGPTRKLVMNRDFAFGLEESILFRPEHYGALKQLFDFVHTQDAHSLVLRRTSQ